MNNRLSARQLAEQIRNHTLTVIDVREPAEFASGHIAGSTNIPLQRLMHAELPHGAIALVCQSGQRSQRAMQQLQAQAHSDGARDLWDLEHGLSSWEAAGLPLSRRKRAPLPLMRQVQIGAGTLILLGLALSNVAPAWIALTWMVGIGLTVAGITGFCGLARLLMAMPWNRVSP